MAYLRFRRSLKLAPGLRLNAGKTGLSLSVGGRGAHYTVHSSGRRTTSVGLPGSGVSIIDRSSGHATPSRSSGVRPTAPAPAWGAPAADDPASLLPHPGFFAGHAEKAFREGIVAYVRGDPAEALPHFTESITADPTPTSPHLFAAICHIAAGERDPAIAELETVVRSPIGLPDALMAKYLPEDRVVLHFEVRVSELVRAAVTLRRSSAVLLLAELYQDAARVGEAVGLVQQLHVADPDDPVVRLSLADLLFAEGSYADVVEAAAPAANVDDVGLATVHLRALALLRLGDRVAAFDAFSAALARRAGRDVELLKAIRYDRALAYESAGQPKRARADLERLFAVDPGYRDVAQRLEADPES